MDFETLGLSMPLIDALRRVGFTQPTSIQSAAIPPLLEGRDLLGRADAGSGKTFAYGIPLIERIDMSRSEPQALVLCPTRELVYQVADDLTQLGAVKGVQITVLTSGEHARTQRMRLPGMQVLVATPIRTLELIEDGILDIANVGFVVIDELDRMLDTGLSEDLRRLAERLPRERQTCVMTPTLSTLAQRASQQLLDQPFVVENASHVASKGAGRLRAVRTKSARKLALLEKLLEQPGAQDQTFIIYCNNKRDVRHVDRELWVKDIRVVSLSGEDDETAAGMLRERFARRELRILLTTDAAARPLELDPFANVINYDVPFEVDDFVRRLGRAHRSGMVTTLVGDEDYHAFMRIRRSMNQDMEMLSESLQPAPPMNDGASAAAKEDRAATRKEREQERARRPDPEVGEMAEAEDSSEAAPPPPRPARQEWEEDEDEGDEFGPDSGYMDDIDSLDDGEDEEESQGAPARTKGPERKDRGNERQSSDRRSSGRGRWSRNDFKRWEEEQLQKPVELIADNWDQVDEIDSLRPAGAGGDRESSRTTESRDEERDSRMRRGRRRRRGGQGRPDREDGRAAPGRDDAQRGGGRDDGSRGGARDENRGSARDENRGGGRDEARGGREESRGGNREDSRQGGGQAGQRPQQQRSSGGRDRQGRRGRRGGQRGGGGGSGGSSAGGGDA